MGKKESIPKRIWKGFWKVFYNSGTVLKELLVAFSGAIVTLVAAMDWNPLIRVAGASPNFDKNQLYFLGGLLFLNGVTGVAVRLNNTKEVAGHLVPKSTEEVKVTATVKDA